MSACLTLILVLSFLPCLILVFFNTQPHLGMTVVKKVSCHCTKGVQIWKFIFFISQNSQAYKNQNSQAYKNHNRLTKAKHYLFTWSYDPISFCPCVYPSWYSSSPIEGKGYCTLTGSLELLINWNLFPAFLLKLQAGPSVTPLIWKQLIIN